jgi:hypothetical protein
MAQNSTNPASKSKQNYAHGAAAVALLPMAVGLAATLGPAWGLGVLNFPHSSALSTGQDQATITGLIRMFGIRDVAIGASSLSVWHFGGARKGEPEACKALGMMMLIGLLVVVVDAYASREVTGGGEWNHLIFAPLGLVLSYGLLR